MILGAKPASATNSGTRPTTQTSLVPNLPFSSGGVSKLPATNSSQRSEAPAVTKLLSHTSSKKPVAQPPPRLANSGKTVSQVIDMTGDSDDDTLTNAPPPAPAQALPLPPSIAPVNNLASHEEDDDEVMSLDSDQFYSGVLSGPPVSGQPPLSLPPQSMSTQPAVPSPSMTPAERIRNGAKGTGDGAEITFLAMSHHDLTLSEYLQSASGNSSSRRATAASTRPLGELDMCVQGLGF
jgi:hypothetical protein